MTYAGMTAPCGCSHTQADGRLVEYRRCARHHAEGDDARILEAAKNARELARKIEEQDDGTEEQS